MNQALYNKLTEEDLVGRTVQTKVPLRNSLAEIPAGTKCKITRKWGGFDLKTQPCDSCGIQFYIKRVPPEKVRFIDG